MTELINRVASEHFEALKRHAQDCCANPNPGPAN